MKLLAIYIDNISRNIYDDLFIRNNHKLNLRSRPELKIRSINSELKGENYLRYHGSVFWNNLPHKVRNLENLSAFTVKIRKWNSDSCKCEICKPFVGQVGLI